MNNKEITAFLIRLSLGFIYLSAGWSKLAPGILGNLIGPVDISEAYHSEFFLILFEVVTFYQLVVGAFILSQKYSFMGLLALFPLALGIFIFTIVAGFGFTIIINLFFLLMILYALSLEKVNVKKLANRKLSSLNQSVVAHQFPNKTLPIIAFIILFSLVLVSFFQKGMILNFLATFSLIIFTLNLFQFKKFYFLDYFLIALFFVVSFIITNEGHLNHYFENSYTSVIYFIQIGLIFYVMRILIFWYQHRQNRKWSI